MSDVPPQPGWWLASDGNWYPPEGWWLASDGRWYPPEQRSAPATEVASGAPPQTAVRATAPGWVGGSAPRATAPGWVGGSAPRATAPGWVGGSAPRATAPGWVGGSAPRATATAPSQSAPDDFYAKTPERKPFWRVTAEEDDTTLPGTARPGWEQTVGSGERKGLRTERSAANYFVRSLIMGAWFGGFLYLVLKNPNPLWLLIPALTIGIPMMGKRSFSMITYRYIKKLWDETHRRVGYSQQGIGWASESATGAFLMRGALWLAIVAVGAGLVGDFIFADAQFAGGQGKTGPSITKTINHAKQCVTSTTSAVSSGGSTTTTNPAQSIQQFDQCTQNAANNLIKQLGG